MSPTEGDLPRDACWLEIITVAGALRESERSFYAAHRVSQCDTYEGEFQVKRPKTQKYYDPFDPLRD